MKKAICILATGLLLISVSCKGEKKDDKKPEATEKTEKTTAETKKVKFALEPKSDSKVSGNVVFTERDGKVSMTAIMEGLTPGTHAIHIHEKADCSSADGKSTGGHWNPTAQPHGKWGVAEGYHKGDIGNFTAEDNGQATITFETDQWCIGCDDATKNIIGKAIIVHQGTDDFVSQPSGAAGARVSCGGIIK
ncbi:superoxide dismutase family protein [Kordia algicida OT-1]|uniref:Copper/Zinc superoxide dismutase n=1 Tax=Kordia algicida OT-1 TaxID=391587 RepID=A9E6F8_9FLAO|nr:superoxide dismutase family protein [Kordia algicida]EDP95027.1 Copper/Zinc superoxide dismutase [Kordia algicida OT-1]